MYLIIIISILVAAASAQVNSIDPDTLESIFGKPPSTPKPAERRNEEVPTTIDPILLESIFGIRTTTQMLQEITVRPTDATSNFVDTDGNACKCVPYYLCDTNLNGVFINNASVTGYGTLDIRFKEEGCQESTELCCKNPKTEEEVVTPAPDPSRLRGCGYRNPNGLDFTITGGTGQEAQFGEFPWVVAVLAENGSYFGVGALIHPQVVVTGAHIAYKYTPGSIKIRAGEWDTQTIKERYKYQEQPVQEMYIHKDFKSKSLQNDMALLRLEQPVQLSDHINVICMPDQEEDFDRHKGCVANGWGKDFFGVEGRYAVILKRVEIDMVTRPRCNTLLRNTRLGNSFKLHGSFVCAGGEEGKDTCQGDGGAPLVCPIGDDRYKLTGLVAWGIGCGQRNVPAVYVNVARFRQWVDDKMSEWGYNIDGYTI